MDNRTVSLKEIEENRKRLLEKFYQEGVDFLSTDGVVIEDSVKIGKGTVIYPNVILKGKTVIGENCVLTSGTVIENCVIGCGCVINATQCYDSRLHDDVKIGPFSHVRPGCEIDDHAKIGDFVEIKNSYIGVGTAVAHLTYVGDSDVGKNVNFGCGCVTVNYDGVNKYRCKIGDNAFIGCNVNLIAPVAVGDNTFIAAGSTITDEVPDGGFAIARSRQTNKDGLGAKKLKDRKLKY